MTLEPLHVTRWGHSGPRLVLVHGSAQGSPTGGDQHFVRQQHLATEGYQLLVPDRPGHGLSADPGRPDDAEADGAMIAELLEGGAHLVGHSFGGCVALAAAAKRPDAVRSLTLIEPAMALLAMNKPAVLRFGLRAAMIAKLPMSDLSRVKRFGKLVRLPAEVRGDGYDTETLRRMGRALTRLKLPDGKRLRAQLALVREARIPVLAVAGSWSPAFRAITDVVAELTGGKTLVIPCEHHFPHQSSEEVNQALVRFMGESERRRELAS